MVGRFCTAFNTRLFFQEWFRKRTLTLALPDVNLHFRKFDNTNPWKLHRMRFKHRAEYAFIRSAVFFINLLPVKAIMLLCSSLGYFAWVVFPFRIKVAYKNLSTVFPELAHGEKLRRLRSVYLQFTRAFGIVFILHRKKLQSLIADAQITGLEQIRESLLEEKGIILTTIHASWFEAYFAWFNMSDLPTSLIYQKQANPLSDDYFVRQRKRSGTSLEHLSSYDGMKVYENALNKNRLLIISLDQNYTDNGISVDFFNRPLSCAKGTGILHLRTGAPVFTSVYYMKDGQLHIDFEKVELPPYSEMNDENIRDITNRSIKPYEPFIRQYTDQWFSLFHRLWSKNGYEPVKRTLRQIFF
jgi:lauroyl/myristoyl acyltransferase